MVKSGRPLQARLPVPRPRPAFFDPVEWLRRRTPVRAAFRAASVATPVRIRVAAPRRAAAFGERVVPRRCRAERVAWRESAVLDAAPLPSRFSARDTARLRLRDV